MACFLLCNFVIDMRYACRSQSQSDYRYSQLPASQAT